MKKITADKLRPGDLVAGTGISGNYEGGPKRLNAIDRAPEHEKRASGTFAYQLTWADGTSLVYYADTVVLLQQRP